MLFREAQGRLHLRIIQVSRGGVQLWPHWSRAVEAKPKMALGDFLQVSLTTSGLTASHRGPGYSYRGGMAFYLADRKRSSTFCPKVCCGDVLKDVSIAIVLFQLAVASGPHESPVHYANG